MNAQVLRRSMLVPLCLAAAVAVWAAGDAAARQPRHVRPLDRTRPKITGAAEVGHVLHASSGRWVSAATFRYLWRRCNSRGRGCRSIGVAGRPDAYVPGRRDVGHRLRVTVIASDARASASSTSRATRLITSTHPGTPSGSPAPGPGAPAPAPAPGAQQRNITAYITGYAIYDNTPPGSPVISNPVLHQLAGGTGTYQDPTTVAVGHSIVGGQDILDWPQATRFYVPNLRRYFIVEDTCGDGPTPQNGPCHNLSTADPGAQTWLDVWVDGTNMSSSSASNCESNITHNQLVIEYPAANYAVVPGAIAGSSCTQQYGNTVVLAGG